MKRSTRRAHQRQRRQHWPQPPAPRPPDEQHRSSSSSRMSGRAASHLIPADCLKYLDDPERERLCDEW